MRNEQVELIGLGEKVLFKQEPQKNYVKHHIEQPKLREGLSIVDGRMTFDPPYYTGEKPKKVDKKTDKKEETQFKFRIGDTVIVPDNDPLLHEWHGKFGKVTKIFIGGLENKPCVYFYLANDRDYCFYEHNLELLLREE